MHHAVLGVGGIGGLIATCLAKSGDRVTLVLKSEAIHQYPKALSLESPFGQFSVEVEHAITVPPADVLWITVKTTQLAQALSSLRNCDSLSAIVPLLNGIDHVNQLRSRYGANRVVPATITVESERVAPGRIVHRSPFARLNVSSIGRTRMQDTLQRLQQIGFTCQLIDDEATLLWSKLVFLAPLALTTTAASSTTGEIAADATWTHRLDLSVQEACAVASAERAKVDYASVIASVRGLPGNIRSSMQKDVDRGNPPELDAIAGPILRGAAKHGIDIPATRELVDLVEQRIRPQQS